MLWNSQLVQILHLLTCSCIHWVFTKCLFINIWFKVLERSWKSIDQHVYEPCQKKNWQVTTLYSREFNRYLWFKRIIRVGEGACLISVAFKFVANYFNNRFYRFVVAALLCAYLIRRDQLKMVPDRGISLSCWFHCKIRSLNTLQTNAQ